MAPETTLKQPKKLIVEIVTSSTTHGPITNLNLIVKLTIIFVAVYVTSRPKEM